MGKSSWQHTCILILLINTAIASWETFVIEWTAANVSPQKFYLKGWKVMWLWNSTLIRWKTFMVPWFNQNCKMLQIVWCVYKHLNLDAKFHQLKHGTSKVHLNPAFICMSIIITCICGLQLFAVFLIIHMKKKPHISYKQGSGFITSHHITRIDL